MKSKLYGNKQDETLESLPIAQGGTSARTKETAAKNLGFVSHDQVKKPDGVIILGEDGYIRKEDLPPDVINAELATLFAPTEVDLGASADIFITNYSSDVTYNVSVTGGTYVRKNDKITFTAGPTITTGSVTVNGRTVTFYVGPPKPVTPSIVSPSGAALNNVGPSVVLVSSDFIAGRAGDTLLSADWQVATDSAFTQVVKSKMAGTAGERTSWTVDGLTRATRYYARIRHRANTQGLSEWSTFLTFQTRNAFVPEVWKSNVISTDLLAGDGFGTSVSIDDVGSRIAVGAPKDDTTDGVDRGSIYVFKKTGENFSQEARWSSAKPVGDLVITVPNGGSIKIEADTSLVAPFITMTNATYTIPASATVLTITGVGGPGYQAVTAQQGLPGFPDGLPPYIAGQPYIAPTGDINYPDGLPIGHSLFPGGLPAYDPGQEYIASQGDVNHPDGLPRYVAAGTIDYHGPKATVMLNDTVYTFDGGYGLNPGVESTQSIYLNENHNFGYSVSMSGDSLVVAGGASTRNAKGKTVDMRIASGGQIRIQTNSSALTDRTFTSDEVINLPADATSATLIGKGGIAEEGIDVASLNQNLSGTGSLTINKYVKLLRVRGKGGAGTPAGNHPGVNTTVSGINTREVPSGVTSVTLKGKGNPGFLSMTTPALNQNVSGSGSLTIAKNVTALTLTGKGAAGSTNNTAGQGLAAYPSGLPPYNAGQEYIAPTGNASYPSGLPPYNAGQAYIAPTGNPSYPSGLPPYQAQQGSWVKLSESRIPFQSTYNQSSPLQLLTMGDKQYSTETICELSNGIWECNTWEAVHQAVITVPQQGLPEYPNGLLPYNAGQPYIAPTGNPSYPNGLPPYSAGQPYIAPTGNPSYPSGLPPYIAPSTTTTTGASTTMTINGQTYTFPGGNGGAASETTHPVTIPAGDTKTLTYNVASGGSGNVSHASFTTPASKGGDTTMRINNQTYTFPGGDGADIIPAVSARNESVSGTGTKTIARGVTSLTLRGRGAAGTDGAVTPALNQNVSGTGSLTIPAKITSVTARGKGGDGIAAVSIPALNQAVSGSSSLVIPAGVTTVTLKGKGGPGTTTTNPQQGLPQYPQGLEPYSPGQPFIAASENSYSGTATWISGNAGFNSGTVPFNGTNPQKLGLGTVDFVNYANSSTKTFYYDGQNYDNNSALIGVAAGWLTLHLYSASATPTGATVTYQYHRNGSAATVNFHTANVNTIQGTPGQPYIAPTGNSLYPQGLDPYVPASTNTTTGNASTIALNGQTYTFPGGYGGAATEQTFTANIPAAGSKTLSYSIAAGGSGNVSHAAATIPKTKGTDGVITIGGQTYTFDGGDGIPANEITHTIPLSGTTSQSLSYANMISGNISHASHTEPATTGAASTMTIDGNTYSFLGKSGSGTVTETEHTVTLSTASSHTLTHNIATGGTGTIIHTAYAESGGLAPMTTHTVSLPGTSAQTLEYNVTSEGYGHVEHLGAPYAATTGQSTTITVNGTPYVFQGGYGGVAAERTENVPLAGTTAANVTYSIASTGSGNVSHDALVIPVTRIDPRTSNFTTSGNTTVAQGVTEITLVGKGTDGVAPVTVPALNQALSDAGLLTIPKGIASITLAGKGAPSSSTTSVPAMDQDVSGQGNLTIAKGVTTVTMVGRGAPGQTTTTPQQGLPGFPGGLPPYQPATNRTWRLTNTTNPVNMVTSSPSQLYELDTVETVSSTSRIHKYRRVVDADPGGVNKKVFEIWFYLTLTDGHPAGGYATATSITNSFTTSVPGYNTSYSNVVSNPTSTIRVSTNRSWVSGSGGSYTVTETWTYSHLEESGGSSPSVGNASYPSGLPPYVPASTNITTGASSTMTLNGQTYTFQGGNGGPASETTHSVAIPGSSALVLAYNIATGGTGNVKHAAVTMSATDVQLTGSGTRTIPNGVTSLSLTLKGNQGSVTTINAAPQPTYSWTLISAPDDLEELPGPPPDDFYEGDDEIVVWTEGTLWSCEATYPEGSFDWVLLSGSGGVTESQAKFGGYPLEPDEKPNLTKPDELYIGGPYSQPVGTGYINHAISYWVAQLASPVDQTIELRGADTTVIINGQTYTAQGSLGNAAPATVSQTVTLSGTASVDMTYSVSSSGSLRLQHAAPTGDTIQGNSTTMTVDGVLYTFPGGTNGAASNTTHNVPLDPSTTHTVNYTIADGGSGNASYASATIAGSNGTQASFTINGTTHTFPGGSNGPATNTTKTVTLTGTAPVPASYIVPAGANIQLTHGEYTMIAPEIPAMDRDISGTGTILIPKEVTVITIKGKGAPGTTASSPKTVTLKNGESGVIPAGVTSITVTSNGYGSKLILPTETVTFGAGSAGAGTRTVTLSGATNIVYQPVLSPLGTMTISYSESIKTIGRASTFVINNQTYMFPGGDGGAAVQKTYTITLPGIFDMEGVYDIAPNGYGNVSHTAVQPGSSGGAASIAIVGGQTYLFPGGNGGPAVDTTHTVGFVPSANAGSVSIARFEGNSWSQPALILPDVNTNELNFGFSIDLDRSGTRVIIGAPGHDTNKGAAYIYVYQNGSWMLEQKIIPVSVSAGDKFGSCVSISKDSKTIAIGAADRDSARGVVSVYTLVNGTWVLQSTITNSDRQAGERFGTSISLTDDGNMMVVGAPHRTVSSKTNAGALFVFRRSGTSWTQESMITDASQQAGDKLGFTVSIDATGQAITASAPFHDVSGTTDSGAIFTFAKYATSWQRENILSLAGRAANDQLGFSSELTSDSTFLVAGAPKFDHSGKSDSGIVVIYGQI